MYTASFKSGLTRTSLIGFPLTEHRRLILSAFRTIGLKSPSVTPQTSQIAEVMLRDVQEYLQFVDQFVINQPDGHIMLEKLTGRLAGSSISSCVFGIKKSFADKEFSHNVEVIEEAFHVGEKVAPFEIFPLLKSIPGLWKPVQEKMKKNHGCNCKYFRKQIDEKVNAADGASDSGSPDSLITIYRNEMAKRETSPEPQILSGNLPFYLRVTYSKTQTWKRKVSLLNLECSLGKKPYREASVDICPHDCTDSRSILWYTIQFLILSYFQFAF